MSAWNNSIRQLVMGVLILTAISAFAGDNKDEPAPRFRAKTLSGENFNNDTVKGKVVLLEFWTTWCPYCRREQSFIDEINQQFSDQGLIVLAVDVGESKKKVRKYLDESPRSCRIVLTEDTNLAAMYAATQYPVYVVVGRDGNIVATHHGAAGEMALRQMLKLAGLGSD